MTIAKQLAPTSNVVLDFIGKVHRMYRGLGKPVLVNTLSIIANRSIIDLGGMGVGKTRTINTTPNFDGTATKTWWFFTYQELSDYCKKLVDGKKEDLPVRNRHLVFKVPEYSTLKEWHQGLFLTVCSALASEGEEGKIEHMTKNSPYLWIKNCKLTMLVAVQPKTYSEKLCSNTQWEAMSNDRFIKFILLNPLIGIPEDRPLKIEMPPIAKFALADTYKNMDFGIDFKNLEELFAPQLSYTRKSLFARDYTIALARFKGKPFPTQEDADELYDLLWPYMEPYNILYKAASINQSPRISTGQMKLFTKIGSSFEPITKKQAAQHFHLGLRELDPFGKRKLKGGGETSDASMRSIEIAAEALISAGLVQKTQKYPVKYSLSEPLLQYFREDARKLSKYTH